MLLALAGLFLTRFRVAMRVLHGATTLVMLALLERSWRVLAVERGWIFGDCEMDLGLPAWFALDKWFPWLFEVQTSCGYTPFVLFQITLAEALLAIAIGLTLVSATLFTASWFESDTK
jgi:disulfide bond formation protein DsbB